MNQQACLLMAKHMDIPCSIHVCLRMLGADFPCYMMEPNVAISINFCTELSTLVGILYNGVSIVGTFLSKIALMKECVGGANIGTVIMSYILFTVYIEINSVNIVFNSFVFR